MKASLLANVFSPVHICIFGEPKSGKTLLASMMALRGYKMLWISLDNGISTILHTLPPAVVESQFEFIRLPDTIDFAVGYHTLLKIIGGNKQHICDMHGTVNCIACKKVPEATWTDVCLNEMDPKEWIIVLDHATALTKAASNKYLAGQKLDPQEYKFEWEDWRRLGVMMDRVFLPIQQSRHNWIVIAHVNDAKQEDGRIKLFPAIGTGNYSRNSGGFFDHVVYCDVANKKHNFGSSTTFMGNVATGSRSEIAIEKEKEPSLIPFFNGSVIPTKEKVHGETVAKKVLFVTDSPTVVDVDFVDSGSELVDKQVPTAANIEGPQAGAATSMHAQAQPRHLGDEAAKALAMLSRMKKG